MIPALLLTISMMKPAVRTLTHQKVAVSRPYHWILGADGKAHKCNGRLWLRGRVQDGRMELWHEVDGCVNEVAPVRVAE